jgi:hypothetical protein
MSRISIVILVYHRHNPIDLINHKDELGHYEILYRDMAFLTYS